MQNRWNAFSVFHRVQILINVLHTIKIFIVCSTWKLMQTIFAYRAELYGSLYSKTSALYQSAFSESKPCSALNTCWGPIPASLSKLCALTLLTPPTVRLDLHTEKFCSCIIHLLVLASWNLTVLGLLCLILIFGLSQLYKPNWTLVLKFWQ